MEKRTDHSTGSNGFRIVPRWLFPPAAPVLDDDEVHVWCAALDQEASGVHRLFEILSEDERVRAEKLHFMKDRSRFIVARGLLRVVLSRYMGMEPKNIAFCYGSAGKPRITGGDARDRICFNLSSSNGLALLGVTRGREIGVDVEHIRTDVAHEELSERFFSPREAAALKVLSPKTRRDAFFSCWTRKEAFIKATGRGLSFPLDQFDVSVTPDEPPRIVQVQGDPEEATRWSLIDIDLGPDFAAALVVSGHGWRAKFWKWGGE